MKRCFCIVGVGTGAREQLTQAAQQAIMDATLVLSTGRLAESLGFPSIIPCPIGQLAAKAIAEEASRTAILVSGDVGFFSAAKQLCTKLSPYGEVRLLPGLSSLQVFCARLQTSYEDLYLCSLHGRQGSLVAPVSYHQRVFALTGGQHLATSLCKELVQAGLGAVSVALGENLDAPEERIVRGTAEELAEMTCGDLAVLLIENPDAVDWQEPLQDKQFVRGKVPMTKEEVRWVAAAKLAVHPTDIVYDIGAGTGAMTLTLARQAYQGHVYAVERQTEALSLIAQNRKALGGYNITILAQEAPEGLQELPAPNAVFIGGSGGKLLEILSCLKQKNPQVRVVITAISLETLQEAMQAFDKLSFSAVDVVQIAAARGKRAGSHTLLMGQNPVFILSGSGTDEA